MKKIILTFSIFTLMGYTGPSGTLLEVEELNLGACWARREEPNSTHNYIDWKFASFNDHAAFGFNQIYFRFNVSPVINEALQKLGITSFPASPARGFFYCGGNHLITFSLPKNEKLPSICAVFRHSKDTGFALIDLNPNYFPNDEAMCLGQRMGELIVIPNDGSTYEERKELANQLMAAFPDDIADVEATQLSEFLLVKMKPAMNLRENIVKKKIEESALSSKIQLVEYNGLATIVGQSYLMTDFAYAGF